MRYCNLKLRYNINSASVKSTAFQNCIGKKKHTLANKTTPKINGTLNVPDNLYCDQTTPWQGVYFFSNTVYREIDTLYMCHSNFIVLLPRISP